MGDFVIWSGAYTEGSCVIEDPEGFDESELLTEGVKLSDQWPKDVTCSMDSEFAKDIRLEDNLYGAMSQVISSRLKDRIAALVATDSIEFLPVTILNHKGRVASKEYFFLNPVGTVDCIDVEKSGIVWNAIDKDMISRAKQLTVKAGAVPKTISLFRPAKMISTIFLRRSIADQLIGDGFTGLVFKELGKYRG
jgi:hypothetical protein